MSWNLKTDRPIYLQLSNYLRLKIVSGCYPPGSKLPSVRELAAKASVSPNTMMKALDELEAEGLIHPMNTRGIFITEDMEKIQLLSIIFKNFFILWKALVSHKQKHSIS